MADFDLSKITGREPPTDDGLPCACEWNAAGEPVGLCAAHQSKLDDELAALRAERDELRSWKAGSLEAARESETPMERYLKAQIAERDNELAALRARVAELEAAIRVYGGHLDDCGDMDSYNNADVPTCGCGYDAIRDALSAVTTHPDWPECSGDPADCPENEGHGCCKPNPSAGGGT